MWPGVTPRFIVPVHLLQASQKSPCTHYHRVYSRARILSLPLFRLFIVVVLRCLSLIVSTCICIYAACIEREKAKVSDDFEWIRIWRVQFFGSLLFRNDAHIIINVILFFYCKREMKIEAFNLKIVHASCARIKFLSFTREDWNFSFILEMLQREFHEANFELLFPFNYMKNEGKNRFSCLKVN